MKRLLILSAFLGLAPLFASAQHNPVIAQYMHHALPLNPALAGSAGAFSASLSYRNEWIGMPGAPETKLMSLQTPLKDDRLAFGLTVWQDQYGTNVNQVLKGIAAYRMVLHNARLSFGLSLGVRNQRFDFNLLELTDQEDNVLNRGQFATTQAEFGAGIYYDHKDYFISFSLPSIGKNPDSDLQFDPSQSIDIRNQRMYLMGGYAFQLNQKWSLRPSVLMSISTYTISQGDLNLSIRYDNKVDLGVGVRTSKAIVSMLRYWINDQFSLAYSYDYSNPGVASAKHGNHEVTLRYLLKYTSESPSPHLF